MNEKQAAALKNVMEAAHPDAGITVTAQPDGAEVTISGPLRSPGLSGPVGAMDVELRVRQGGPIMTYLLASAISGALEGEDSRLALVPRDIVGTIAV